MSTAPPKTRQEGGRRDGLAWAPQEEKGRAPPPLETPLASLGCPEVNGFSRELSGHLVKNEYSHGHQIKRGLANRETVSQVMESSS